MDGYIFSSNNQHGVMLLIHFKLQHNLRLDINAREKYMF